MIKTIFWDFDGVIMNSMPIRDRGFELIFCDFPKEQVDLLMEFHRSNGGLSRYVKIRHFFEEIRGEKIDEHEVVEWAQKFSDIMKENLVNPSLLIEETVEFIKEQHMKFDFHVVSGSDGKELNYLCEQMDLSKYFKSIHGSPTPKTELTANLIKEHAYDPQYSCLIGDSHNDHDAAVKNGLLFFGYNNPKLVERSDYYIESFKAFTAKVEQLGA